MSKRQSLGGELRCEAQQVQWLISEPAAAPFVPPDKTGVREEGRDHYSTAGDPDQRGRRTGNCQSNMSAAAVTAQSE